MDLGDKVIIVTGASSGIGEATARRCHTEGAKVVLVARRRERLAKLAAELGSRTLVCEADVADKAACKRVIDATVAKWGRIDILVNNAGVMLLGATVDAPLDEWEQMVAVNLTGLMYMTYMSLPVMRKQKSGHVVNISSVAGRTTNPGSAVYNATKWGVNAFTDALRQELAAEPGGIRTTLIEPGAVDTELISHNRPQVQEELGKRFGDTKRLEAVDIANAIYYAISQPEYVSVNEILIRPTDQAR